MEITAASKNTMVSYSNEYPAEYISKLLEVAYCLTTRNQVPPCEDYTKVIKTVSNDFDVPQERTLKLLGFYLSIIRQCIDTPSKEFNQKLLDLGFGNDFLKSFQLVCSKSNDTNIKHSSFYKLELINWRIDISLYRSAIINKKNKNKRPTNIMLHIRLKNGKSYTLNIDIRTFHSLRFNVALIITDLSTFKNNHTFGNNKYLL